MFNKNIKHKRLLIYTIIVCLFISTIQISVISEENTKADEHIINLGIDHPVRKIRERSMNQLNTPLNTIPKNILNANTPILMSDFDCKSPAIASNDNNILVVAENFVDTFDTDLIMTYSSDGGNTWGEQFVFSGTESAEFKPVVDYCGNNEFQAYGTALPDPMVKTVYLIHFPSMIDPEAVWGNSEGWTLWSISWEEWNDFYAMDIAGYPHGDNAPAPEFHGTLTMIGAGTNLDEIENIYETVDNGVGACYLEFTGDLGDTLSVDIDISEERYFEVMELTNDPDYELEGSYGVFYEYCWLEPGNENWWENDWPVMVIEHATNPDIAAADGKCFIVCELEGDIVCYYSTDAGENFESSIITNSGSYPTVSIIGDTVFCSYFRDGNIFASISEDGGQTWEEDKINDVDGSVLEESHAADVSNNYISWTDDRNNNVVYFDVLGEVSIPIIEIDSVSGGIGVSAVIKNVGTADATDVDCSITVTGGLLGLIDIEVTSTENIPVGGDITINSGMILGFGNIEITVNAGSASEVITGKNLLIYTSI